MLTKGCLKLVIALPVMTSALALADGSDHPRLDDYVDVLIRQAEAQRLDQHRQWLRLGRWQANWFGGHTSQVDGKAFFLAPNGKGDPRAELAATIRGFFAPPALPSADASPRAVTTKDETTPQDPESSPHAFCRFPARFAWLNERLRFDLDRVNVDDCPGYQHFLQRVAPQSVTLVFSSYYFNNPASAFGHTFLRIAKATNVPLTSERQELLDIGIDYGADVDTANPFVYAFRGVSGLFRGTFTLMPYYYKVREYNDYESRDLWDYQLALTPRAIHLLVANLWELGATHFDYFYATENCSYHILGLLDVADANFDLLAHVPKIAIPADTLKALFRNPGLVERVTFRPTTRSQFNARVKDFAWGEKSLVRALAADPAAPLPPDLSQARQVKILDAAADLVDVRHAHEIILKTDSEAAELKQQLLARRAAIPLASEELKLEPPAEETPHMGHESRRALVGLGMARGGEVFQTLGFRLALHDLVDPVGGYPELSQIEFFSGRLRFRYGANALRVDDLTLMRAGTLNPLTQFDYKISWWFDVAAVTIEDNGCDYCLAGRAAGGTGFALSYLDDALTVFAMVDLQFAGAPDLGGIAGSPIRLGFGPAGGMRIRWHRRFVSLLRGHWLWLPEQTPSSTWQGDAILRWAFDYRLAVGFEGRGTPRGIEGQFQTLFYF